VWILAQSHAFDKPVYVCDMEKNGDNRKRGRAYKNRDSYQAGQSGVYISPMVGFDVIRPKKVMDAYIDEWAEKPTD
jgi:hypothetical protein